MRGYITCTVVLSLSTLCTAIIADCSPQDENLTFRDPSPIFTPRCEIVNGIFTIGTYSFVENVGSTTYANVSFSCFNSSGSEVRRGFKDNFNELIYSRRRWRSFPERFQYNFGLRCDFTGCFEMPNGEKYLLESSSCYIDFDECSSDELNGCSENSSCVNDEEGTYTCPCNEGYIEFDGKCNEAPVLQEITPDTTVLDGSTVPLNCTGSSSQGNATITWTTSIPGLSLPQPTEITLDENTLSSSITLDSVDSSYNGDYTCTVANEFGHVNDSVFLNVISILKVDRVMAFTGTNASLFCNDTIEPGLNYSWDLELTNHTQERVAGILTNELTITDVSISDSMKYTCNVSLNGKLVGLSTSYLDVEGPKIVKHPENATLTSPLNLMLNCSATTSDDAATRGLSFHWLKNGRLLESPVTSTVTLSGEVMVNQLQVAYNTSATQMDSYQCLVTNRQLEDATESLMAFITIYYNACSSDSSNDCDRNARCIYDGNGDYTCQCNEGYTGSGNICFRVPNITVFDVPKVIESGSSSTLRCMATGHPMPHITWFHDEQLLQNNSHTTISSNTSSEVVQSTVQFLVLTEEDSGEYICQANFSQYVIIKSQYVYVESSGFHRRSTQLAVIGTSIGGVFILCLVVFVLLGAMIHLFMKKERKYHSKCVNHDYKVDDVKIEDIHPYTA